MGIDYDIVAVFGVSYSHNELKDFKLHEKIIDIKKDIRTDYLPRLWEESDKHAISASVHGNSDEDYTHLFGLKIGLQLDPSEMRDILDKEEEVKTLVREFSQKYNLKNKENDVRFIIESVVN